MPRADRWSWLRVLSSFFGILIAVGAALGLVVGLIGASLVGPPSDPSVNVASDRQTSPQRPADAAAGLPRQASAPRTATQPSRSREERTDPQRTPRLPPAERGDEADRSSGGHKQVSVRPERTAKAGSKSQQTASARLQRQRQGHGKPTTKAHSEHQGQGKPSARTHPERQRHGKPIGKAHAKNRGEAHGTKGHGKKGHGKQPGTRHAKNNRQGPGHNPGHHAQHARAHRGNPAHRSHGSHRGRAVSLHASRSSAGRYQLVSLRGGVSGNLGGRLHVQRFEGGSWRRFPVTAGIHAKRFRVRVALGRPGPNRLRVVAPGRGVVSDAVTIRIRR